jgi:hypothetical protein
MKCPFCGSEDTQVIDTRANLEANTTRRRRKCAACEKRFTIASRAAQVREFEQRVSSRSCSFSRVLGQYQLHAGGSSAAGLASRFQVREQPLECRCFTQKPTADFAHLVDLLLR